MPKYHKHLQIINLQQKGDKSNTFQYVFSL